MSRGELSFPLAGIERSAKLFISKVQPANPFARRPADVQFLRQRSPWFAACPPTVPLPAKANLNQHAKLKDLAGGLSVRLNYLRSVRLSLTSEGP